MATPAQITANRLNAQRSTGPRSEEGKAASRFNALKHAQRERQSEESGAAVPARVPPFPAAQPAKPAVFVSQSAPIGFVSPIPPFAAAGPTRPGAPG